jgi:hypothetical protein
MRVEGVMTKDVSFSITGTSAAPASMNDVVLRAKSETNSVFKDDVIGTLEESVNPSSPLGPSKRFA